LIVVVCMRARSGFSGCISGNKIRQGCGEAPEHGQIATGSRERGDQLRAPRFVDEHFCA